MITDLDQNLGVYILLCIDGSYYVGVTNDIERRLYEHNTSDDETAYTYRRRPAYLVFYEDFSDAIQATAFEKQVKGWSRKKKEALIQRKWDKLKELATCSNNSHFKHYVKSSP
jgi:putative endonuclease